MDARSRVPLVFATRMPANASSSVASFQQLSHQRRGKPWGARSRWVRGRPHVTTTAGFAPGEWGLMRCHRHELGRFAGFVCLLAGESPLIRRSTRRYSDSKTDGWYLGIAPVPIAPVPGWHEAADAAPRGSVSRRALELGFVSKVPRRQKGDSPLLRRSAAHHLGANGQLGNQECAAGAQRRR